MSTKPRLCVYPFEHHSTGLVCTGLDLRDAFALAILQSPTALTSLVSKNAQSIAALTYEIADAMIAERAK